MRFDTSKIRKCLNLALFYHYNLSILPLMDRQLSTSARELEPKGIKPIDYYRSIGTGVEFAIATQEARSSELEISQDDVIQIAPWDQRLLAEQWLKIPAGWDKMPVHLFKLGSHYSVLVRNIGADAGEAHGKSGFLADLSWQHFEDVSAAFSFIIDPNLDKYRHEDRSNRFWRNHDAFIEHINKRGQEFVDGVNENTLTERLQFVQRIVDLALKSSEKSS